MEELQQLLREQKVVINPNTKWKRKEICGYCDKNVIIRKKMTEEEKEEYYKEHGNICGECISKINGKVPLDNKSGYIILVEKRKQFQDLQTQYNDINHPNYEQPETLALLEQIWQEIKHLKRQYEQTQRD